MPQKVIDTTKDFLSDREGGRPWSADGGGTSIVPLKSYLGRGTAPLEVAVATSTRRPSVTDVRRLWKGRYGRAASPLLLVVTYSEGGRVRTAVCGPVGEDPAVPTDLDAGQVERIATAALDEPDRHAAIRFLHVTIPEGPIELPGIRNVGMFATHELRNGLPTRPGWKEATKRARPLLDRHGRELIQALGFTIEARGTNTSVLRANGTARAIAVFLEEKESPDASSSRFGGVSPIWFALKTADDEGLPFVVVTRAKQIRIYAAGNDVGVGRKGRAETFIEANLTLLPDELAGYLTSLFSAEALLPGGTFEATLSSSKEFAADLGKRLRDRVYVDVVPTLARAIASHRPRQRNISEDELAALYEQALIVLFRLLFVAYAEDKDLLPYRSNGVYRQEALKSLAITLAESRNQGKTDFDPKSTDLWSRVVQIFRAVDRGNRDWAIPGYNGGLFSSDPRIHPLGAEVDKLELTNQEVGPALMGLLVELGSDEVFGPVDFRSLSVREFGTIYEGLLESRLSVAMTDLAINPDGSFVPAKSGDQVEVPEGEIYIHNRSGARKTTGSYFTKSFAVDHLLDHSLEPALTGHIERLNVLIEAGEEAQAAESFFDFRCADIAMGSGHFLVAAVDRIEARLSSFLAEHPVSGVIAELERLRAAAHDALGDLGEGLEIEYGSLLRRQVARRCIYGVDVNHIAVELARLSTWIHTFVPGLPLSFLDHNLVHGDSITGIASLDEAVRELDPERPEGRGTTSIFEDQIRQWLGAAADALRRLGRISEATSAEIEAARRAQEDALEAVEPARRLFDLLVAVRIGEATPLIEVSDQILATNKAMSRAQALARDLKALHFPIAFPEVFLRDRPGFDCLIGNPPWDKVLFEPQQFWVARVPGLNALSETQREKAIQKLRKERPSEAKLEQAERKNRERLQILIEAAYPNRGRGHYDLAKLFVERALGLLNQEAVLGYVLPANCLLLSGWGKLRTALLTDSEITAAQTRNKGGWLFEDVEHRTAVVLLTRQPATGTTGGVIAWPGIASLDALHKIDGPGTSLRLPLDVLATLSETVVVPWLNSAEEASVFESIRTNPSLSSGEGWISGSHDARWDFRGSGPHRKLVTRTPSDASWKVLMTRHVTPFAIDTDPAFQLFVSQPGQLGHGIEASKDRAFIGKDHPLIVFRHPSRNDDSRTMIATALPLEEFLHNKGYVHAVRHGPDTTTEQLLALLGFLNTFSCDWWVRRFVDRHVTAPVINNVRLPHWTEDEVNQAARITADLLKFGGYSVLAGHRKLSQSQSGRTVTELTADLEFLTAVGFGLDEQQVALVLQDFSERPASCPPKLRAEILERFQV